MNDRESKSFMLSVEAIGLTITGTLVLVIATGLQLALRGLSAGALRVDLWFLAYAFVFYIFSMFLTVGTRDRPDHVPFAFGKIALHVGYAGLGLLLFPGRLPIWAVALGLGCSAVVLAGRLGFARLRSRSVQRLVALSAVDPNQLVERAFFVRAPLYRTVPVGAALGTLYGSWVAPAQSSIADPVVGILLAVGGVELVLLAAGAVRITRDFLTVGADESATVSLVSASDRHSMKVSAPAPSPSSPERNQRTAHVAGLVRQVLVVSQAERLFLIAFCVLAARLWRPLRGLAPMGPALLFLLVTGLLTTLVPLLLGQRATHVRQLQRGQGGVLVRGSLVSVAALAAAFGLAWVAFGLALPLLFSLSF